MTASIFTVSIENKNGGGCRTLSIVTDTIQNAMSIAKCQCNANEEVTFISKSCGDPYIDFDSIMPGD